MIQCLISNTFANSLDGWGQAKFGMTIEQTEKILKGKFNKISGSELDKVTADQQKYPAPVMLLGAIDGYKFGKLNGRLGFWYGTKTNKLREITFATVAFKDRQSEKQMNQFKLFCLKSSDELTAKYGTPIRPTDDNNHGKHNGNFDWDSDSFTYLYLMDGGSVTLSLSETNFKNGSGDKLCHISYKQAYEQRQEGFEQEVKETTLPPEIPPPRRFLNFLERF